MAGNGLSKADLQDAVDSAIDILTQVYVPESDRETLAAAVGDALDALEGNAPDDDGDDDSPDDDGDYQS